MREREAEYEQRVTPLELFFDLVFVFAITQVTGFLADMDAARVAGRIARGGEIIETWRRSQALVTIGAWRRLSRGEREAVEAEAASLPLPGLSGPITVSWST